MERIPRDDGTSFRRRITDPLASGGEVLVVKTPYQLKTFGGSLALS
jgi:hypothetical protein